MKITFTVNGDPVTTMVEGSESLLELLRGDLNLVGTKWGCMTGDCGACTVLIDDRSVVSCLQACGQLDGRDVTTIEGLISREGLSDLQQAFVDHFATQCGFCTPGMILAAEALIESGVDADEAAIREGLSGNLCRCTGYNKIVDAVKATIEARR